MSLNSLHGTIFRTIMILKEKQIKTNHSPSFEKKKPKRYWALILKKNKIVQRIMRFQGFDWFSGHDIYEPLYHTTQIW